jgi:hypothetical protein
MTSIQVRDYAREQYARAILVVDAEVQMPMNMQAGGGALPMAFLHVIRQYKGAKVANGFLPVIYFDSCDIALTRKGERIRVLLSEGPRFFQAKQYLQAPGTMREGAQFEFNAEIDRLAGVSRPRGFSVFPGALEPAR